MEKLKKHFIPIVFFIIFLAVGFLIYRDYGMPWDEETALSMGKTNYEYITQNNPALYTFKFRYYGALFETILYRLTGGLPKPEMYYARHLVVFLTFWMGVLGFYFLANRLFRSRWWALLTAAFLVLSPRLFADAFYNSKDIAYFVAFIFAMGTLVLLLDKISKAERGRGFWLAILLHGITTGMTIATRIPGMVLVPISAGLMVLAIFISPKQWKQNLAAIVVYFAFTLGAMYIFWPILWHDPINEFINAYNRMSHFPWAYTMLYRGKLVWAEVPLWHYIPVWITISTPLMQLISFVIGALALALVVFKKLYISFKQSFKSVVALISFDSLAWMAILACIILPMSAVIILRSVLYDGWRQMYFIYPSILLVAVWGLRYLYDRTWQRWGQSLGFKLAWGGMLAIGLLDPLIFTAQCHPYQNVYFNVFAGNPAAIRQTFEQDYWGLSYKQAVDYILVHDSSPKIKMKFANAPGMLYSKLMLSKEDAKRVKRVENVEDADYFLSEYRWHPEDYPYGDKYYSINVRGSEIMVVYRLKPAP